MLKSYRIGRIFGFPIDINLSFLILLGVVLLWMGGLVGVFTVLIGFASVLAHELGHALVARHLGVPIGGIELYFFGGAAKLLRQPKSAGDEIAIAAAGPAVSFVVGGLSFLLAALTGAWFFSLLAWINLIIGAFNLIPALPMDGGRIFRAALSFKFGFLRATELSLRVSRGFAIFLGVVGLATGQLQLVILAVVVWFLGTAELNAARISGYGNQSWPSDGQVMPFGFAGPHPNQSWRGNERDFNVHRPRPVGGFVIRQHGGRFFIEPM